VVRPSYVLGGRAMAIVRDEQQFEEYLLGTLPSLIPSDVKARYPNDKTGQINTVLGQNPLLFDRYLSDAIEVDVDCLCDGKDVFIAGIMEHIEEAGIHSGDSACSLPPRSLSPEIIAELERPDHGAGAGAQRRRPHERAIRDQGRHDLRPRGEPARVAHGALRGQGDRRAHRQDRGADHGGESLGLLRPRTEGTGAYRRQGGGVPLRALPGPSTCCSGPRCAPPARSSSRPLLRVRFREEPARLLDAGAEDGTVFVSVRDSDKERILPTMRMLSELGFQIVATAGTAALPRRERRQGGAHQQGPGRAAPTWWTPSRTGTSTSSSTPRKAQGASDSRSLRRAALLHKVPYYTTLAGAIAAAEGIKAYLEAISKCDPCRSIFPEG
jgi:carbamoyl-phosphate synthase large subunit